jgi:hypothetical protein
MSFVTTQPEALAPPGALRGIGSSLNAAVMHELFVKTLGTSSGSYAAIEAANAAATG